MPTDMEIVCPFCEHRTPLIGDPSNPVVFEGDCCFLSYDCPCGAKAFPKYLMLDLEVVPDDTEENQRDWFLGMKSEKVYRDYNYATHTEPPMLLLWSKRRESPAP